MILFKLAYQNIIGAGLRTWLNVVVLSLSFVAIIWLQGFYIGMQEQAIEAMKDSEIGGGQYWQLDYDPYDPLSLQDSHSAMPNDLQELILQKLATPILITQATIYPEGRLRSILLKGINPDQTILNMPTQFLASIENGEIPALIGSRMAKSTNLKIGDYVTVRWRDGYGSFDAAEIKIVQVMKTMVPSIDVSQIWIPLSSLRTMMQLPDEATMVVLKQNIEPVQIEKGWTFRDLNFLLKDLKDMVQSKSVGASILYVTLLSLALLAIFNTQVLSIFRRRKEIGTLMALGMSRGRVIRLFTLEGAFHGILAALAAAIYGIPLLLYSVKIGWGVPGTVDSYGFAIAERLFPMYSVNLIIGTILLIFITVTIVSFLPTRKIVKLNPTEALRGKKSW